MNEIKDLHHNAMELADEADRLRRLGSTEAETYFRRALAAEKQAANLCAGEISYEPTRSVLHRSAASLALECKEFREAERLIAVALSGNPPNEIAEELRDLLEQVYFERHLDLRGVTLDRGEFQLSIAGPRVGRGLLSADEFRDRVQSFERLIHRTAERRLGFPYRESASPPKVIREDFEVFLSVPRAASFAVTFRVGRSQRLLPYEGVVETETVVNDVVRGLENLNSRNLAAVRAEIPQESYYRNFVALARNLAPDGRGITLVGLTMIRDTSRKEVLLTTTRNSLQIPPRQTEAELEDVIVTVRGSLLFADATTGSSGKIRLVDESGAQHPIVVPEGMMADIVRPLWDNQVIVEGMQRRGEIYLEDIRKADEPPSPNETDAH